MNGMHCIVFTYSRWIRCLDDVDDEVRDRAAMYLKVYQAPTLADAYVKEGRVLRIAWNSDGVADNLSESIFSLSALEARLVSYISDADATSQPFDVSSIPKVSREQAAKEVARKWMRRGYIRCTHLIHSGPSTLDTIGAPSTSKAATPPPPTAAETQSQYSQQLAEVPEFADYGPVLSSGSKPAQLTERETEYQVSCVKHIFKEHTVFQVRIVFFTMVPQSLNLAS